MSMCARCSSVCCEAPATTSSRPPVSDVSLPGLDGVALLRRVHAHDPHLPVILVTGTPAVESAAAAVELRAQRYLLKPLQAPQLRQVVAEAVEQYRAHLAEPPQRVDRGEEAAFDEACAAINMHFQPIVSWSGKDIYAYEALVRPTSRRINNPGALFEAATRLGRIEELGRIIRHKVSQSMGDAPCQVFVNLHPFELNDEELYAPDAPLTAFAQRVVLEITERAALEDIDDVSGKMARLRALGYRVAVDDLGAGYSGLTSIAQLEPEVVKLDMALIRDVHLQPTKQHLIRSMIGLFNNLGRQVIAEGVENSDEARTLVGLGCDLLQGYHFARPMKTFEPARF
jgi:EAL domain-containing protein (putative c-di-GMP-specific phosphodiesterase class I)